MANAFERFNQAFTRWRDLFMSAARQRDLARRTMDTSFYESVLDYCSAVVERSGEDERRQRPNFWATLALMRCVASSPAAAVQALRTRMNAQMTGEEEF